MPAQGGVTDEHFNEPFHCGIGIRRQGPSLAAALALASRRHRRRQRHRRRLRRDLPALERRLRSPEQPAHSAAARRAGPRERPLADRGRPGRADHPQAGCCALHRARRGDHLRARRQRLGPADHRVGPGPGPRRRTGLPAVPLRGVAPSGRHPRRGRRRRRLRHQRHDPLVRRSRCAVHVGVHRVEHDLGCGHRRPRRLADRPRSRRHRGAEPLRGRPRGRSPGVSPLVTPAALEARGWGWRYATRLRWAVREADLRIEPGERVLLLGASGSGKSTLLQGFGGVLGGADEGETHGELLVDGVRSTEARGRVGMVLQDPDTQTMLARVGDDVAFGCENLGVPREEIWHRVREALDAVQLDVPLDRSTNALSGGQKQRLALAGVLAMRPGAILLDEPTANLDPEGVRDVRDAVAAALDASGATLIVIEHRIDVWLPLVTRVIVLGAEPDGTIVLADGTPGEVLGARGAELAASGVWVPGHPPAVPPPPARASGDLLLETHELVVSRRRRLPVAGPLDLDVRAGEAIGITGANGSGKSTFGLTLAGLIPAERGRVAASALLAAGEVADPLRWSSRALLTRIATVLQTPEHQLLAKTVREELSVGPRALRLGEAEIAGRTEELLERLRLAPLAEANPYTLSGGEKRRLTVAAALATRPQVIVLDEPTFGQDARTWAELVSIIARLRDEGTAIVAISHDEAVLQALHARRFGVGA
ncbi:ABC transporter ATP-binding protein [Microbacterium sp. SD291]|nr:ABC transporter ATP-binding protein [Microbacterium sp. SD291]